MWVPILPESALSGPLEDLSLREAVALALCANLDTDDRSIFLFVAIRSCLPTRLLCLDCCLAVMSRWDDYFLNDCLDHVTSNRRRVAGRQRHRYKGVEKKNSSPPFMDARQNTRTFSFFRVLRQGKNALQSKVGKMVCIHYR